MEFFNKTIGLFRKKATKAPTTDTTPSPNVVSEEATDQRRATTQSSTPATGEVFEGARLPSWSTDELILQRPRVAEIPPDVVFLTRQAIARVGRGSLTEAVAALHRLLGAQIDKYASVFPQLKDHDFDAIRRELFARSDFDESMLFTSLTYFGTTGVAMNNQLIEQIPGMIDVLEDLAREGHLDGDVSEALTHSDGPFEEPDLPDWSTDPITRQEPHVAKAPPDLVSLAKQTIEKAGRGSGIKALSGLYAEVGRQIDIHAAEDPHLRNYDFKAIRHQVMLRPDFDGSMLFSSLTYFGSPGITLNNSLIDMLPEMIEAFENAAHNGQFDTESTSP